LGLLVRVELGRLKFDHLVGLSSEDADVATGEVHRQVDRIAEKTTCCASIELGFTTICRNLAAFTRYSAERNIFTTAYQTA
jgi:hypothetical protein